MKRHMHEQNRLWDYEVLRELGRGQYGTVFQVKSKKDGKIYALKKINIAGTHEKQKIQAFREIKALKLITHPDIIEYYESFLSMDNIYIVTQYAERGDLSVEIKRRVKLQKKYTEEQLWKIIQGLVLGIKHLHQKGIIHRDIKTQNIFLTGSLKYKIGDLGMSKIIYNSGDLLSTRVGTPIYFAPEIIQHCMYTFPVDIWALGCVIYSMAALQHPYKDASIETLAYYIVDHEPRPIKGAYSPQLISFIMSMLDKNPQTRPTIHDLYKKIKARAQTKINNKVSIFNLKQILSLKAQHFQELNSQAKSLKAKAKEIQQDQEQVGSPTRLSHHIRAHKFANTSRVMGNDSMVQAASDNPEALKSEKRNLSMVLPKSIKSIQKSKESPQKSNSPMIKSNGFSFYLGGLKDIKGQKATAKFHNTARYSKTNNLSTGEPESPVKLFKQGKTQFFPRRARARVELV